MNNPYGVEPEYALYPLPVRATGHRIWQMIYDKNPDCQMSDYRDAFDRRNLLVGEWSDERARVTASNIIQLGEWKERTVVLFGAKVRDAFRLPKTPCGSDNQLDLVDNKFTYFHWVPHPSGLNQWYNKEENRDAVADLLARLYRGERGQLTIRGSMFA